jgi:hypothetical protein
MTLVVCLLDNKLTWVLGEIRAELIVMLTLPGRFEVPLDNGVSKGEL